MMVMGVEEGGGELGGRVRVSGFWGRVGRRFGKGKRWASNRVCCPPSFFFPFFLSP